MTEQQNPIKPVITVKTTPEPPIQLYKRLFCRHCTQKCALNTISMQNCILTQLLDETTRLRQTIQQRTMHLSW